MVTNDFAQKFIRRIHQRMDLDMSILNEYGVVISSTSAERNGRYSQTAAELAVSRSTALIPFREFYLDQSGERTEETGVCALVMNGIEISCIIAVYGQGENSETSARLIRFTLEEMQNINEVNVHMQLWPSGDSRLINAILFEEPINVHRIKRIAAEYGYQDKMIRIPIYLHLLGRYSPATFNDFIKFYRNSSIYQSQDIILNIDMSHALIYKYLPIFDLSSYRISIESICNEYEKLLQEASPECYCLFYYSTPVTNFEDYRISYECLTWMSRTISASPTHIHSFMQHISAYLISLAPAEKFSPIFQPYAEAIRENMNEDTFLATVEALYNSHMNIPKAAEMLFVHKNTLSARMKKIKDVLDLNPFFDNREASFLFRLMEYMKRTKNA